MELSENAKVVLLLCCPFQAQNAEEEKQQVLSAKQWHQLYSWLEQNCYKPQDLLNFTPPQLQGLNIEERKAKTEGSPSIGIGEKIIRLLQGGGTLGFLLEGLSIRGIQVVTIVDQEYPSRLRERLKDKAPPFLFYAGDLDLLGQPGIAVVGSRNIDDATMHIAAELGDLCGQAGLVLYSGGARGIDQTSMRAALKAQDGYVVGILAHPLSEVIRNVEYRQAINRKRLCLATPFVPEKGFQTWKAMARNKIIYALADYAVVIQSDSEKGGTWAGAVENSENRWVPLFVLDRGDN
ncbi:MAG: DNA-processing protein DprA, partial [Anaerolineales bacterium]